MFARPEVGAIRIAVEVHHVHLLEAVAVMSDQVVGHLVVTLSGWGVVVMMSIR